MTTEGDLDRKISFTEVVFNNYTGCANLEGSKIFVILHKDYVNRRGTVHGIINYVIFEGEATKVNLKVLEFSHNHSSKHISEFISYLMIKN